MDAYPLTAQKRVQKQQETITKHREKAWKVERTAAALLKNEYGAAPVAIFGSLVQPKLFNRRSDVGLAVWGLDESEYFRAMSRLLSLDPDISVDIYNRSGACHTPPAGKN